MAKTRLLHIGYPKCMSTSLQLDYFNKHPEIYFLGWGRAENVHGWITEEMASIGEVDLRYAKSFVYDEQKTRDYLLSHIEMCERDESKKLLCFSSESMAFTFHYDIDVVEKARRLHSLFGPECKVLMVIRNQLDLFRSFYFECIRCGYQGDFNRFIEYHYFHQFRTILTDMYYDRMFDLYARLFGVESVAVVPMELLVREPQEVLKEISLYAGINPLGLELKKYNNSDDKRFIEAVRQMNEKYPNNMGSGHFGMTDTEKLRAHWKVTYGDSVPEEAETSYSTRTMIYRAAAEVIKDYVLPKEAEYSPHWRDVLNSMFAPHNRALAEMTGLDLQALGYPCEFQPKADLAI